MYIRNLVLLGIFAILGSTQFGCYYDNEEDLYNLSGNEPDTCGVSDISYSIDLVPILDLHCNNACHNESTRLGNVILDSYANLFPYTIPEDNLPFSPLIGSMLHDDNYSPMPQGGKLEKCDIALFEKWIEEGTKNN